MKIKPYYKHLICRKRALPVYWKLIFVLMISVQYCLAEAVSNVPPFALTKATIQIPVDIRAFQGDIPKEGNTASYNVQAQYFPLPEKARISIPKRMPNIKEVIPLLSNPYLTLAVGSAVDKFGDNPGRLLLCKPACAKQFAAMFDVKFTDITKKMFEGIDALDVILAIQSDDRILVFYEMESNAPQSKKKINVRSFQKVAGIYLFDCGAILDPLVLNILTVLTTQGRDKLKVIAN